MERIIRHIERLFIKNDYVIIPGLGGFVLQQQSARITPQGIIPPYSTVGFNARMDSNDGLLATEVLRAENLNYRSALALIEAEVAAARKALHDGREVSMGQLGSLRLNAARQTVYRPSARHEFIPANFGLDTLYIAPHGRVGRPKEITLTLPPARNLFRYAASILILVTVLLSAPRMGDGTVSELAGWDNPLSLFSPPAEAQAGAEALPGEAATIAPTAPGTRKYHVIVSCLPGRTAAERYCELLQAKHYDNARVLPSVRTNRIAVESFSEKEIALLYLSELRRNHEEFRDAWLYREP